MHTNKQNLFYITGEPNSKPRSKVLLHGLSQYYVNPSTNSRLNSNSLKDDLYRCMRVLLCFGRVIGIVPLSGLFNGNLESVSFRFLSLTGITSFLIILALTINELISIFAFLAAPARDASEIAKNAGGFVCYGIGLYVFIYMFRNSTKLVECLYKWREVKTIFRKQDTHLFRNIFLLSAIFYASAILENLTSHWKYFKGAFIADSPKESNPEGKQYSSVWENYYVNSHSQHASLIPYNLPVAIGIFLCNKWAVYAWDFGDILIAVIALAMYKRFKLNHEDLSEKIHTVPGAAHDETIWLQAVKDHENLVSLLEEFADLLSPLIFVCVSTNIYFICLVLNSFLVPKEQDVVNNVYEAWAFIHLLLRTYATIFCCAKVNVYAHKIEHLLSKCPVAVYNPEVKRSLFTLKTSSIGFGGLGCFVITKPFILSAFNVIFTFEIVLLQSATATPTTSNSSVVK